jgi:hypothetical protein
MKEHPIDDLFAKKLSNWEPKASPDLWNRIEGKQQTSSREGGWWYWYAAAGVVFVMMVGYMVWQGQNSALQPANETIAKLDVIQEQTQEIQSIVSQDSDRAIIATLDELKNEIPKSKQSPPSVTFLDINPTVEKEEKYVAAIDIPDFKPIQKEGYSPQASETSDKSMPIIVPMPTEIALGLSDEPKVEQSKNRVIVAHILVNEDETKPDGLRSSKFIKVLRQLKNVKEGDTVDWQEVGFNPKNLIARADERLKNKEEKVSKYYQNLKEKTKL